MIALTTLFNTSFVPQGVCLIESVFAHVTADAKIFVLCLDDDTKKYLTHRFNKKIVLLSLTDILDQQLLILKSERKYNEFCWTITPTLIRYVSENYPEIEDVFYCDADTVFLKSSDCIFRNFLDSAANVYITEHGYDPIHDQTVTSGRYCVQLIGFKNAENNDCLKYWDIECRNWCFDRLEEGKFGDQKYLENFEKRFPNTVYVEPNLKGFQAPWNCNYYRNSDAVFYHFHSLRIASRDYVHIGNYEINQSTYNNVYLPYMRKLISVTTEMAELGIVVRPQIKIRSFLWRKVYEFMSSSTRSLLSRSRLRKIK